MVLKTVNYSSFAKGFFTLMEYYRRMHLELSMEWKPSFLGSIYTCVQGQTLQTFLRFTKVLRLILHSQERSLNLAHLRVLQGYCLSRRTIKDTVAFHNTVFQYYYPLLLSSTEYLIMIRPQEQTGGFLQSSFLRGHHPLFPLEEFLKGTVLNLQQCVPL